MLSSPKTSVALDVGHALLDVDRLGRDFGPIAAVKDLSFSVSKGEVVGFLGPNGAGKSTTLQMLAGALAPSTGRVTIDGVDLFDDPLAARARVGYLPEQPPLYRDLSVDEQLRFCAALRNVPRARREQAVANAKARTGLSDSGRRIVGNLSKGFAQRVGIAQALVHEPQVVLLDEPTSGLDPNQLREIRDLVVDLRADHAVMLSTHILGEVQSMCDRVLMLHLGELVLDAPLVDAAGEALAHLVRVRDMPDDAHRAALEQQRGIASVQVVEPHTLRVEHDGAAATVDAMMATLFTHGVRELRPERSGLEQLFANLTQASPGGARRQCTREDNATC